MKTFSAILFASMLAIFCTGAQADGSDSGDGIGTSPVHTAGIGTSPVHTAGIGTSPVHTAGIGTSPVHTAGIGTSPVEANSDRGFFDWLLASFFSE